MTGWELYNHAFTRALKEKREPEDEAHLSAYFAVRDSYGRRRTEEDRRVLDELNR